MMPRLRVFLAASVLLVPCLVIAAEPVDRAELEALRDRVRELEQQLQAIAQRLDAAPTTAPARPAPAPRPVVDVSDRGYTLNSADGENAIRLRALVQFDARVFGDDGDGATDTLALRRARLISEGTLARRYGFQLISEFGGSSVSIRDANLTAQLAPAVQVKAGKLKTPVGMELLQPTRATAFIERSLVTEFVPNRDVGLQLSGDLFGSRLNYTAGVFNGLCDGMNSSNTDLDEPKDFAGRLLWRPFVSSNPMWQRLQLGIGGTRGRHEIGAARFAGYRTGGRQTYFAYRPAALADGTVERLSPQFDYRGGPLGLMGEYVVSTSALRPRPNEPLMRLRHRTWQLTSSWVVTGEESSYRGLAPRADFSPADGSWGAFEVLARYAHADFDDAAFPAFAAPEESASAATAVAFGLNWHLSKAVRFMINYSRTTFEVPAVIAVAPLLRNGERLFASRLQLAF